MSDIQPGDTAQWRGDGKHTRGCVQVRVVAVGELGMYLVKGENGLSYWVHGRRLTRVDAAPASPFQPICTDYELMTGIAGNLSGTEL